MSGPAASGVNPIRAERLGIDLVEEPCPGWPLILSRYSFHASLSVEGERFDGFGCAADEETASLTAVMECLERAAQFGPRTPRPSKIATTASLAGEAIPLDQLGLYSEAQYGSKEFPFAKLDDHEVIEWIRVSDLCQGGFKYVPIEFVYPRVQLARKRLVAETSSGTAAHYSIHSARLAACCELIERDSILMFWARQPATAMLQIERDFSAEAALDIQQMVRIGYVVVACTTTYDLGVPCVLAIAMRGDRMAYGAGCHPDLKQASEHAVKELGRLLRWQHLLDHSSRRIMLSPHVNTAADHFALYDGGPLHDLFRRVLNNTVRSEVVRTESLASGVSDEEAFALVANRIRQRGYHLFECDITSDMTREIGGLVVRLFAPGLIPMYFGGELVRYGCKRLWEESGPGSFCNTLPHFIN